MTPFKIIILMKEESILLSYTYSGSLISVLLLTDSKERTEEEEKIILFRVYFPSSYNINKIMELNSCNEAK